MQAIIFGAVIGLLFGGLRGAFVGAAIAFAASWGVRRVLRSGLGLVQSQFVGSAFAVMGALSKADSVVTRDEIRTAEALFDRLRLSGEQREAAKAAFSRGKAPDFDLDTELARFAQVSRGRGPLLQLFLQVQVMAVAADGNVHPAEHEMLVYIARRLGLTRRDVAQLEALLRAAGGPFAGAGPFGGSDSYGGGAYGGGSYAGGGRTPQQKLDDAYEALGLARNATDAEIKRAYRRLMSENHPDKLAGKGLPESMRALAEERTSEISTAYRLIKEARQVT